MLAVSPGLSSSLSPRPPPWLRPPRISPSFLLGAPPNLQVLVAGCVSPGLLRPAGLWGRGPRAPVLAPPPCRHPALARQGSLGPPRGGRGLLPGDQCFAAANWVSGPPRGGGLGTRAGRGSRPGRGAGRPGLGAGSGRCRERGGWGGCDWGWGGDEVGISGQFREYKRGLGTEIRDKKGLGVSSRVAEGGFWGRLRSWGKLGGVREEIGRAG